MIIVNSNTRQFNVPGADLVFGVESDSGSEVKNFQCPRYVGNNLDIAGCFVRINYRNANGEIDSYLIQDIRVEGDNVLFDWVLSPKVTLYKGQVRFVMCVIGPDTKLKWHTTLGMGQVLEGLEPDSSFVESETADVVAQLIAMVEAQTAAVEAEGTKQIKAVQSAAESAEEAAVAQIEAKGVNVRESIPDDYSALSEAVDGLTRGRAGAIICEASGSAVVVNDASDLPMQSLRVFGRSTQDGVPSPEAPVEIKSVVEPVVTVCGKNLFDGVIGSYAISQETVSAASAYVGFICPVVGGHTYTVSRDSVSSDRFRIAFTKIKPTSGTPYIGSSYSADMKLSITAYAPEDATYLACYLSVTHEDVSGTHYQVELGDHATTYEPYSGQTVELTHTLPGIPVASGGNYTDSEGQQWICDEVDFERGVYVQRVKTDTVTISSRGVLDNGLSAGICKAPDKLRLLAAGAICDRAKFVGISGSAKNPNCFYENLNNFGFTGAETDTLEMLQAAYDGATVVYILANPIETPLSETELATLRELHSNYPNTTVLNDAGAHMIVKYAADTKLYIDRKIAALGG